MGVSVISVDENYEIDSSDYYSDDYLALKIYLMICTQKTYQKSKKFSNCEETKW